MWQAYSLKKILQSWPCSLVLCFSVSLSLSFFLLSKLRGDLLLPPPMNLSMRFIVWWCALRAFLLLPSPLFPTPICQGTFLLRNPNNSYLTENEAGLENLVNEFSKIPNSVNNQACKTHPCIMPKESTVYFTMFSTSCRWKRGAYNSHCPIPPQPGEGNCFLYNHSDF